MKRFAMFALVLSTTWLAGCEKPKEKPKTDTPAAEGVPAAEPEKETK